MAPLVERGYSVVTFDAPGHGASAGSRSSLPHFAWALRGVADAVSEESGAASVHAIIAHSFGCAAATLALRDGLAVHRLVYLSPPLNPVEYTARFGDILGLDTATIAGMQKRIEERFARKWSDYSLEESARAMTAAAARRARPRGSRDVVERRRHVGQRVAGSKAADHRRTGAPAHPARQERHRERDAVHRLVVVSITEGEFSNANGFGSSDRRAFTSLALNFRKGASVTVLLSERRRNLRGG